MTTEFVTKHEFKEHQLENDKKFDAVNRRLDDSQSDRDKYHKEVMEKLTPLYELFQFREKMSKASKKWLVLSTQILAFIVALVAVVGIIWKVFGFAVSQTK